jgi:hypothetical protein
MLFNILLLLFGWCLGSISLSILVGKTVNRGNSFGNSDFSKDCVLTHRIDDNFGEDPLPGNSADESNTQVHNQHPIVF